MPAKPPNKQDTKIDLKTVKRKVIIWTILAIIVTYAVAILFVFAPNAHAESTKRLDLQDITSLNDCVAQSALRGDILLWIPDANPGQTVTAIGDIEDGGSKQFTNVSGVRQEAHCIKLGTNACGGDTFFSWGCDRDKTAFGISPIWQILTSLLNWLAVGVTIAVVGGIVYGAILYTSAGGKSDQAKKAMNIIRGAIIALLLYFAMFAVINFLIPGGLFR